MSPDDPRHGTYAGTVAHHKSGSQPCLPCALAGTRYRKQSRLDAHRGLSRTVPLGADAWRVVNTLTPGQLTRQGVPQQTTFRLRKAGPACIVRRTTRDAILAAKAPTPIGLQRRLRALSRLGWSMTALAAEMGIGHADNLRVLLARDQVNYVRESFGLAIVEAYDRLLMQPAPNYRGSTRARNRAVRLGWLPPLAFDDIDDPDENPTGWEYAPPTRAEQLTEWVEQGQGISYACRSLNLSRDSLDRWCRRNDLGHLYAALTAREYVTKNHGNQYAAEAS